MHYMTTALPIRFRDDVLARLRRRAGRTPGATPSGLAQLYVEEGMRTEEHPGVVFKDGPSGRRATVAGGPDVWEVIRAVREIDERGDKAVSATAELLNVSESRIRLAMHYYSDYPHEIDTAIEQNEREAEAALQAWKTERQLLA